MEDGGEVLEREAAGYSVYADAELGDVWRAGLREEGEDVGSRGGFLGGCYAIFEVVGDCVGGEGAGFFEKLGGGGWD